MKYIFSLLFICVIFGHIFTDETAKIKMAHEMKSLKNIVEHKELLQRKLQSTDYDYSDEESGASDEIPPESPVGNITKIPLNETDDNVTLSTDKGYSKVQIKKFHNFRRPQETPKIYYNVFFYFLNRLVVRNVIIYVKIYYYFSLRNLEEPNEAYRVPSNCTIKKDFEDKIGMNATNGENIDYDCEAPANKTGIITNVTVDKTIPLDLGDGETVDFGEIYLDEDTQAESDNLVEIEEYDKAGVLDKSLVEFFTSNFQINGTASPSNLLKDRENIRMEFIDYSTSKGRKNITCAIQKLDTGTDMYSLDCGSTIKTYISNITNAISLEEDIYLKINVIQNETGDLVGTKGGNAFFRKKSDGLSGGAITGIIIASVVAVIAAAVLAILLKRRPKPKHKKADSTTVVSLETAEHL